MERFCLSEQYNLRMGAHLNIQSTSILPLSEAEETKPFSGEKKKRKKRMNINRKRYLIGCKLEFDAGYLLLVDTDIERISKGVGSIKDGHYWVSESFLGIDISEACNIHNFDYVSKNYGRAHWDRRLLNNIDRIIKHNATSVSAIVTLGRYARARVYYAAVRAGGRAVFDIAKGYFK